MSGTSARLCFELTDRMASLPCAVSLTDPDSLALAELLPLLGCGEEAAALGFDRLGESVSLDHAARRALRDIAHEERLHDSLMSGLRAALPAVTVSAQVMRQIRRYHLSMARGGAITHLARIVGLDAAVCLIMSRLLHRGGSIAHDQGVSALLSRIRRDEARHVALSRALVIAASGGAAARDRAAEARHGLADLVAFGAAAFETLGVDPDDLIRDIRIMPNGLLPA